MVSSVLSGGLRSPLRPVESMHHQRSRAVGLCSIRLLIKEIDWGQLGRGDPEGVAISQVRVERPPHSSQKSSIAAPGRAPPSSADMPQATQSPATTDRHGTSPANNHCIRMVRSNALHKCEVPRSQ